jgi:hypothetical protein
MEGGVFDLSVQMETMWSQPTEEAAPEPENLASTGAEEATNE